MLFNNSVKILPKISSADDNKTIMTKTIGKVIQIALITFFIFLSLLESIFILNFPSKLCLNFSNVSPIKLSGTKKHF